MKKYLSASSRKLIQRALAEDIGSGDITSRRLVPGKALGNAVIIAREEGVFFGRGVADEILKQITPSLRVRYFLKDGERFVKNKKILELSGSVQAILAAERTMLNFLGHLCGVASVAAVYARKVKGYRVKILDTRKTTPGMRELEKLAVKAGGGFNHRQGLWHEMFIKENHRPYGKIELLKKFPRKFVIEVRNVKELEQALTLKPRVILFDNFTPSRLKPLARLARARDSKVLLEASGGITFKNIRQYAAAGIDQVSIGALTHSVRSIDFSLLIQSKQ